MYINIYIDIDTDSYFMVFILYFANICAQSTSIMWHDYFSGLLSDPQSLVENVTVKKNMYDLYHV